MLKVPSPLPKSRFKGSLKALLAGVTFLGTQIYTLPQAQAASPAPGTIIENQATGSFVNPSTSDRINIESNIVQVSVAEVAGITLAPSGVQEAASSITNAGPNQGNNNYDAEDIVYFLFTATNTGNDPTQFFIPGSPSNITNATQSGEIEIISLDPDGSTGATAPTNFSSVPITIRPEGNNTGDATAMGLPVGAIPAGGSITIRVPIKLNTGLTPGNLVSVTLGDVSPNDNSSATQNQDYTNNSNLDLYTQDNKDTNNITNEAKGTPINGDPTFHRKEASATNSLTLTTPGASSDFGDAPDTYGTLLSSDGARHTINANLYLGPNVPDAETDALTPLDGSGDGNDEDGITLAPLTTSDSSYTIAASDIIVTNNTGTVATLHAWIDFNQDGEFESGEYASTTVASGTNQGNPITDLNWNSLSISNSGVTYARFRLTTDGGISSLTPNGNATNGEVEDYQLIIDTQTIACPAGNGSGGMDIIFLVDNSGSVDSLEFSQMKTLIEDTIDQLITPGGSVRGSVVHYYTDPSFLHSIYIESDFTDDPTDLKTFVRRGTNGDFLAPSINLITDALNGTPAAGIVSPQTTLNRTTGSQLSIIFATDALRGSGTNSSGSWLVDQDNATTDPFGFMNTFKSNFNATVTAAHLTAIVQEDIDAAAALASVGGNYTGTLESNPGDPEGNQVTPRRLFTASSFASIPLTLAQDIAETNCEPPTSSSSDPNVLLVKRITSVNGNNSNDGIALNTYDPDLSSPYDDNIAESNLNPPDTTYWPNTVDETSSTFLLGARNAGTTFPEDEIEYTIYFLSTGEKIAKNVQFCDRIPDGQTFVANPTFASLTPEITNTPEGLAGQSRGILISHNNTNALHTNIGGDDAARFYPPGSGLPPACNLQINQTEHNGAIVVNLGDLPPATGSGTPADSYGFVRFRVKVN